MIADDTLSAGTAIAKVFEDASIALLRRFSVKVRDAINVAAWEDPATCDDHVQALRAFANYILPATNNQHLLTDEPGPAIDAWQNLRQRDLDELSDELHRAAVHYGGSQ